MRRDILIRGTTITHWENKNLTGLAPGASLISEVDWRLLVGEPAEGEIFEGREAAYIDGMGWICE